VVLAVAPYRIGEPGAHPAGAARAAKIEERPLLAIKPEASMTPGGF
jgi:hypothetical protein